MAMRPDAQTAKELLALRQLLRKAVPPRRQDENLIIATWNVQKFGASKTTRALHYIGEICSRFDIVALQEVQSSLKGLEKLQAVLGSDYRYLFSDVAGNNERLAYLYDRRRVTPTGFVAELVNVGEIGERLWQWHRTPYCASFCAGSFDFILVTAHIVYPENAEKKAVQLREIEGIAERMIAWSKEDDAFDRDMIVLGDFNIFQLGDATFAALKKGGLVVPPQVQALASNFQGNKHYDQVAYVPSPAIKFTSRAGVAQFGGAVFQEAWPKELGKRPPGNDPRQNLYAKAMMSDHVPLWVEFAVSQREVELTRIVNR